MGTKAFLSVKRNSSWATVALAVVALMALSSCTSPRSNGKEVAAAENEAYDAVVRVVATPDSGFRELMFDESLFTEVEPGTDSRSCQARARRDLKLENQTPELDSLGDKLFRFFDWSYDYSYSLKSDTIQDFVAKMCTGGRLSQGFHTDLPKTFVARGSAHFERPVDDGSKLYTLVFPRATDRDVISFSRVGLDSTLHEGIVAAYFVCGVGCGGAQGYALRKKAGGWQVVRQWLISEE
jgi:hypothetical protein